MYHRNMQFFSAYNPKLFSALTKPPQHYNLNIDKHGINIINLANKSMLYPIVSGQSSMLDSHRDLSKEPLKNAKWNLSLNFNPSSLFFDEKRFPLTGRGVNEILKNGIKLGLKDMFDNDDIISGAECVTSHEYEISHGDKISSSHVKNKSETSMDSKDNIIQNQDFKDSSHSFRMTNLLDSKDSSLTPQNDARSQNDIKHELRNEEISQNEEISVMLDGTDVMLSESETSTWNLDSKDSSLPLRMTESHKEIQNLDSNKTKTDSKQHNNQDSTQNTNSQNTNQNPNNKTTQTESTPNTQNNKKDSFLNTQIPTLSLIKNLTETFSTQKFLPHTAIYGLMGGIFLQELLECGYRFHSLLIYEENIDLFRISLYFLDYERLFANINHDACFIAIKEYNEAFISTIIHNQKVTNSFLSLELKHYDSINVKNLQGILEKQKKAAMRGWGSYEDEKIGLLNALVNLKSCKMLKGSIKKVNAPICVVGNGPSLDLCLDFIRAYKDRMIIFSCGTALSVLNHHGIKPDFQIEIERVEYLADVLKEAGLHDIALIHAQMVDSKAVDLSMESYAFMRAGSASAYLDSSLSVLDFSAPFVGNAGVALASLLGSDCVLCGLDCGYILGYGKHAKHSFYGKESAEIPKDCFKVESNRELEVYSNDIFYLSAKNIEQAIKLYPCNHVINIGHGMKFKGTLSMSEDSFTLKEIDKKAELEHLKQNFKDYHLATSLCVDTLKEFRSEIESLWSEVFVDCVESEYIGHVERMRNISESEIKESKETQNPKDSSHSLRTTSVLDSKDSSPLAQNDEKTQNDIKHELRNEERSQNEEIGVMLDGTSVMLSECETSTWNLDSKDSSLSLRMTESHKETQNLDSNKTKTDSKQHNNQDSTQNTKSQNTKKQHSISSMFIFTDKALYLLHRYINKDKNLIMLEGSVLHLCLAMIKSSLFARNLSKEHFDIMRKLFLESLDGMIEDFSELG